jgi:hypothetical protein
MDLTQLTAVERRGYWTVCIAWPKGKKHYLGEYKSEREVNEWIKQHRWLTAKEIEEKGFSWQGKALKDLVRR